MKKNLLLFLATILIAHLSFSLCGQNFKKANEYIESKCLSNSEYSDSIIINLSKKELKKESQESIIIKTTEEMEKQVIKKIENNDLGNAKKILTIMRCLIIEKEPIIEKKKKRQDFFSHYQKASLRYAEKIMSKEKISPDDYYFLYFLEMSGIKEIDNLAEARKMASRYIMKFKKEIEDDWSVTVSNNDDKKRENIQKGIAMLIEVYKKGLNKNSALRDFEIAIDIYLSYIPKEYRHQESRKYKKIIAEELNIHMQ